MDIPPRVVTDRYFERWSEYGRSLGITFDVDVGELVEGHRVVARGIEHGPHGARLHYEFVPAIVHSDPDRKGAPFWYWSLAVEDDLGTEYNDSDSGAFDDRTEGAASHGERNLGGAIPTNATRLSLRFAPAPDLTATSESRLRLLVVDLEHGLLIDTA